MDTIIRNVGDIAAHDLKALEHMLGRQLGENQQLVIQVINLPAQSAPEKPLTTGPGAEATLPPWCNVYAGLSDEEIADLEKTILVRADLSRTFE